MKYKRRRIIEEIWRLAEYRASLDNSPTVVIMIPINEDRPTLYTQDIINTEDNHKHVARAMEFLQGMKHDIDMEIKGLKTELEKL